MNLHQQELQVKLTHICLRDIALLIGYNKVTAGKAASRIANVLSDPYLGLYAGKYDFKYSDEQFLSKLCEVVGVNISDHELDAIRAAYTDRRDRFKSYVFVDTGFQRTGQPIFALAFCEHQRNLQLDYDVRVKPIYEQVEYIKLLVRKHYAEKNGVCGIWGDIQKYVFFYEEGCQLALNPDGVILGEPEAVNIGKATLTARGADVTKLLVCK